MSLNSDVATETTMAAITAVWLLSSLKRLSYKVSRWHSQTFPSLTFFWEEKDKLSIIWPAGSMWPTRSCKSLKQGYALYFLQPTWLPNKKHTHTHKGTHSLHQCGQKHTQPEQCNIKNMIQMISMVRDEEWLEEKKQNVIFMSCANALLFFSSWLKLNYIYDISIFLKIETFCCPGWLISWGFEKHLAIKVMSVSQEKKKNSYQYLIKYSENIFRQLRGKLLPSNLCAFPQNIPWASRSSMPRCLCYPGWMRKGI